jgi:hypothetical protein
MRGEERMEKLSGVGEGRRGEKMRGEERMEKLSGVGEGRRGEET